MWINKSSEGTQLNKGAKYLDNFLYCPEIPGIQISTPTPPNKGTFCPLFMSYYFTGINSFSTKAYLNLLCNQGLNKVSKEWWYVMVESFISPHPFVREDSDILLTERWSQIKLSMQIHTACLSVHILTCYYNQQK